MNDDAFLARAAELAAPWMTFPNPRVGCVIVDDRGMVVGEGAHHRAGGAHAEINALAQAGDLARGATAYVTLEPHARPGRTPPCTDALIAAGVARVVVAVPEVNAAVAGGAEAMRSAGIVVDFVASPAAEAVNEHWLHAMRAGRPFVTLKLATTLDGRVAAAEGVETAISNRASRRRVHALRARVDGILVGSGTALADDPRLDVRDIETEHQPRRFVMGRSTLPPALQLWGGPAPATQLLTHDPHEALAQLHQLEIRHLLIEGGPTIARAFIEAQVVDELVWITAPRVLGAGPSAMGPGPLAAVSAWRRVDTHDVEGDLWSVLRPR